MPFGPHAEQLSDAAFTAPRAENRRSWLYRLRPTATSFDLGGIVGVAVDTSDVGEHVRVERDTGHS